MKILLNIAILENDEIETFSFKNINDVTDKILNHKGLPFDLVYLLHIKEKQEELNNEILVTENFLLIRNIIENFNETNLATNLTINFHGYKSYEEAYEVALNLKEISHLCYKEENK